MSIPSPRYDALETASTEIDSSTFDVTAKVMFDGAYELDEYFVFTVGVDGVLKNNTKLVEESIVITQDSK